MTEKNASSIPEFARRNGISRSTAYREAADGHLRLTKIRGRTLITKDEELRWLRAATQPPRRSSEG